MQKGISIHALREEGDLEMIADKERQNLFLSTPSARRATKIYHTLNLDKEISIHALREEGDRRRRPSGHGRGISIHALREEGDRLLFAAPNAHLYFYPRPPRGGRLPALMLAGDLSRDFYPRPPRGGRRNDLIAERQRANFYPRPPRGGRQLPRGNSEHVNEFLSTPSARRATQN